MLWCTHQNRRFVLSKRLEDYVELVEPDTGELVKTNVSGISDIKPLYKPTIPDVLSFYDRPRSFVNDLQSHRMVVIQSLVKRRKTRQPKDPNAPKKPRGLGGKRGKKVTDVAAEVAKIMAMFNQKV